MVSCRFWCHAVSSNWGLDHTRGHCLSMLWVQTLVSDEGMATSCQRLRSTTGIQRDYSSYGGQRSFQDHGSNTGVPNSSARALTRPRFGFDAGASISSTNPSAVRNENHRRFGVLCFCCWGTELAEVAEVASSKSTHKIPTRLESNLSQQLPAAPLLPHSTNTFRAS